MILGPPQHPSSSEPCSSSLLCEQPKPPGLCSLLLGPMSRSVSDLHDLPLASSPCRPSQRPCGGHREAGCATMVEITQRARPLLARPPSPYRTGWAHWAWPHQRSRYLRGALRPSGTQVPAGTRGLLPGNVSSACKPVPARVRMPPVSPQPQLKSALQTRPPSFSSPSCQAGSSPASGRPPGTA